MMVAEATDGTEAREAVAQSRARLAAAKAREPMASRLVTRLTRHLEVNHFAERMDIAYGREHKT